MDKTRVLLVDPDGSRRHTLSRLLTIAPDLDLVGEAATEEQALEIARACSPEVIVVHPPESEPGALSSLRQLLVVVPHAELLILSDADDPNDSADDVVVTRLRAARGASRARALARVAAAIHTGNGSIVAESGAPRERGTGALSTRERAVLREIALGYTSRQIAERLGVGPKTVETYRVRIARKLGSKARADLVRFALTRGLVDLGHNLEQ